MSVIHAQRSGKDPEYCQAISSPEFSCPSVSGGSPGKTGTRNSCDSGSCAHAWVWKAWVLSIMPNRPLRDQWEWLRKMERHFPIKPGQPKGMPLVIFLYSFRISYVSKIYWRAWIMDGEDGQWTGLSKGNSKFWSDRSKWTTSRGDPKYFGRKHRLD